MKKKILCIDDSNTALLLLEYAINEAGFQATLAQDVEEAIQIIKTYTPDLILLDLSMPEISGYDFLKMRDKLNIESIPIIVISAYDSAQSVTTIMELGAVDFISKPIKMEEVLRKIKVHLKL